MVVMMVVGEMLGRVMGLVVEEHGELRVAVVFPDEVKVVVSGVVVTAALFCAASSLASLHSPAGLQRSAGNGACSCTSVSPHELCSCAVCHHTQQRCHQVQHRRAGNHL